MSLLQLFAAASAPLVLFASLTFPSASSAPVWFAAPAPQYETPMPAIAAERLLLTCGNRQADLRHPETSFCITYFTSRKGRATTSGMCGDCVASCVDESYGACRDRCARACDLGMLERN